MSIVTRTGDSGTTGLVGTRRVSKSDPRIQAYGTVDELNAVLGLALVEALPSPERERLERTQHMLFHVGADLAAPDAAVRVPRIRATHVEELEGWIAELEAALPPQTAFILPGGTRPGALLHLARTVCRRAERRIRALGERETLSPELLKYMNRLGDYLFVAARSINAAGTCAETTVRYDGTA